MNYFVNVNTRSPTPPHVHPLLLSLALMFKESETSLNLSSVSEDNPKVLSSIYYASPKDLPQSHRWTYIYLAKMVRYHSLMSMGLYLHW